METASNPQSQAAKTQSRAPKQAGSPQLRAAIGIRSPSGWLHLDDCAIAYEEISEGDQNAQPILCLHAAGSGSREFHPLRSRRPTGSRLIFVDWPGHGRSGPMPTESTQKLTVEFAAAILQNLLDRLEIDKPILLGSGFGAAAAIRFAANFPDRTAGLALCQPAGLLPASSVGPVSTRSKLGISAMLRRMQRLAPEKTGSGTALAAKRQALRLEILRPAMRPTMAAARTSLEQSATGLRSALDSLTCPTLFALSRDNQDYPLRKYIALLDPSLAWAPKYRYTVFAGAFHPIWEEPERFSHMLDSFVQAQLPVGRHTHAWIVSAIDWPTKNNNLWKCVHPDCSAERVLPVGRNANAETQRD